MAAIVNTRDLILQAAATRIELISLDGNITVPQSQVDGLPAVIAGTKVAYLRTSSEVFQVAKSGTVTPSVITLTSSLRNIIGSPTWTVVAGTATLTTVDENTKTLSYANMATDSVTITVSATDGGVTYTDTITLVKLREGSDAVNMILSNENHTVVADKDGNALSFSGAGTTISVYIGTTDTTASWTFTKTDGTGVTSSISGSSLSVTAMTAATTNSYVDITASRNGFPSIVKRMTLSKARSGIDGQNGANGTRGAGTFYATGSSWSDAVANAACPGGPIAGDMVTIGNGTSYVLTKKYDGAAWGAPGQIIDGNLFVTNSIQAAAINTNGLTVRDASGNILLGAGTKLDYKTWLANLPASLADINATQSTKLAGIETGATYGATLGSNVGGKITSTNVSTLISSAAIGSAYIVDLSASKISAGTMTAGDIYFGSGALQATASSGNVSASNISVSGMSAGNLINPNNPCISATAVNGGAAHSIRSSASSGYNAFYASVGGYGPFTGAHDVVWENDEDFSGFLGDIMVDVECVARNGLSNTLFKVERSSRPMQQAVVGVFVGVMGKMSETGVPAAFTEDEAQTVDPDDQQHVHIFTTSGYAEARDRYTIGTVNALGEGQINVCGEGGDFKRGDLIVTSSMPGKGMRQPDDIIRGYTVAKVREDVTFTTKDEVKTVACIYLAG